MRSFNPPNLIGAGVKTLAYDTETTGLDWKVDHAVGHVVTVPGLSVYYPTGHKTGPNYDEAQVVRWLNDLFATQPKVYAHNAKFDMHFAFNAGVKLSRDVRCTQVLAGILDEEAGKYSLSDCSTRYGVTVKKGEIMYRRLAEFLGVDAAEKGLMGHFWELPADDAVAVEYAEGDGISTLELGERLEEIVAEQELERVWEVERKLTRVLWRMEQRGVCIDEAAFERMREEIAAQLEEVEKELPGLNVKSGKQLAALFDANGRPYPLTEAGNPSFDRQFLETCGPLGEKILDIRVLRTLQSTFLEGAMDQFLHNGRIHANINQSKTDDYGTRTRRLSYNDPNLQQVPKRNRRIGKPYRKLFLPDEGMFWSTNDYSQVEPRLLAHFAGVRRLIDGYNATPFIDMHTAVLIMLRERGRLLDLPDKEARDQSKTINLGVGYGMGEEKLAKSMGIPRSMAKSLLDAWHGSMPEVKKFMSKATSLAMNRGYVKTALGWRRHFPNKRLAYKAGNSVIQGSGADLLKLKMVEVDEYFENEGDVAQLLVSIHDALDWQAPEGEEGEKLTAGALEIMHDVGPSSKMPLRVPMFVDSGCGPNWSIATYGA